LLKTHSTAPLALSFLRQSHGCFYKSSKPLLAGNMDLAITFECSEKARSEATPHFDVRRKARSKATPHFDVRRKARSKATPHLAFWKPFQLPKFNFDYFKNALPTYNY